MVTSTLSCASGTPGTSRSGAHRSRPEWAASRLSRASSAPGVSEVIAGGNDGSLLLLDAGRGTPSSGPHEVSERGVQSLARVQLGGRRLLLCGRIEPDRRGPRAWDLDAARLLPGFVRLGPGHDVAIAAIEIEGRMSAVIADNHALRVVDLNLAELQAPSAGA